MALFVPNSEITIGSRMFSGVHEVVVRRGLKGYNDSAIIRVPSIGVRSYAKQKKNIRQVRGINGTTLTEEITSFEILNTPPDSVTTGKLFSDGDKVTIKLGYNGELREEFRGFVMRRGLGMPLLIECEGYVRQLRLNNNLTISKKTVTVKELMELACKGTDIRVECAVDMKLTGIKKIGNGIDILDHIIRCSDRALTIFFKEPDLLWCGLVYTPYLAGTSVFNPPTVKYRLGWNCVKDNGLKEKVNSDPVQYIINGKTVSGDTVRTESKDKVAARKVKLLLNNVGDESILQEFAQEKQLQANYTGYEGHITGMLQPFCLPGYDVDITDARYPERNGVYMAEATEVTFGVRGAKRRVQIGPKLGNK